MAPGARMTRKFVKRSQFFLQAHTSSYKSSVATGHSGSAVMVRVTGSECHNSPVFADSHMMQYNKTGIGLEGQGLSWRDRDWVGGTGMSRFLDFCAYEA